MEKSINFLSDHIVKFGRTDLKDSTLLLVWPGSGFGFSFFGNELRINFGKFDSERHFYFQITIDKIKQTHCICADDQVVVIRGLSDSEHHANVIKVSESIEIAEVSGITISGDNVSFTDNVSVPSLKVEFIGDSLTAGFGNMSEPDAGVYRASEQDVTMAYAYLTAKGIKADGRYVCCSGKGVFNNWDGTKHDLIPTFYMKTFITREKDHDFKSWQPDIIFINAGTNDITAQTDPNDFMKAYIKFVKDVHRLNPDAIILCLHGMTTDKFAGPFEQIEKDLKSDPTLTDLKIEFIKFKTITEEFYGALWHPNSKAHAIFARELIKTTKRFLPR